MQQPFPGGFCSKESHSSNNLDLLPKEADLKEADLKEAAHRTSQIRGKAKTASGVWDRRYIRGKLINNPPSEYSVWDEVLIRFSFSRHSRVAPKRHFVIKRKILKILKRIVQSILQRSYYKEQAFQLEISGGNYKHNSWKSKRQTNSCQEKNGKT